MRHNIILKLVIVTGRQSANIYMRRETWEITPTLAPCLLNYIIYPSIDLCLTLK